MDKKALQRIGAIATVGLTIVTMLTASPLAIGLAIVSGIFWGAVSVDKIV